MNILLLNGSPRKGSNTRYALSAIAEGLMKNSSNTVEIINISDVSVGVCIVCNACQSNGGNCVRPDDTKATIDKISAADMLIMGTPVYWWGVSAQLKAVVDKFYSKNAEFKTQKKKLGVVAVGASAVPDSQYTLIHEQFNCIANFLNWEKIFELSFSAYEEGELEKSAEANIALAEILKKI